MKIIDVTDLPLDDIYGTDKAFSDEGIEKFRAFISENEYDYYGESAENFSITEAIKKATDNGKKAVVVENLS